MRCTPSCSTAAPPATLEEGHLGLALRKGGGLIPQAASTVALPAETAAVATPGPQRGAEAGPRGGTTMATAGFNTPRATTPRAAGDGSRAGLRTLLVTRAELQGLNGMSLPPRGGASAIGREAGLPSGNARRQGADPGGGPAAHGAKLSGNTKGGDIAMRGEL